ncbi:unnamed protein product, partial [Brenthis ino]
MIDNSSEELKSEELQQRRDGDRFKSQTYSRVSRNVSSTDIPNSTTRITSRKSKVALVKKPIPKFSETDSEEDYQAKVKHPVKFSDSVEHEDEDFSIDDYDFDVHHDEFAGREKPLQPRIKVKVGSRVEYKSKEILKPKIVIPRNIKASDVTNVEEKRKDEYDDDSVETTETPKLQKSVAEASDDYISEESSKEYEGKSSVRTARSPLSFGDYLDKLGQQTSSLISKILSILPIFPQVPKSKKLEEP